MAEHNFATQGPKSYYNQQGRYVTCSSKEDVTRAKQDGFTSEKYVPSRWPKTAFNKLTGATKPVGNLDWTDEKNMAAEASIGDGWTFDHVPVPEPVAAATTAQATSDLSAVAAVMADVILLKKRMEESEEAIISLEVRIVELEAELSDPLPADSPAKVSVAAAIHEGKKK